MGNLHQSKKRFEPVQNRSLIMNMFGMYIREEVGLLLGLDIFVLGWAEEYLILC